MGPGSAAHRKERCTASGTRIARSQNGARKGPVKIRQRCAAELLDLRFLELDVLARDRIVLLLDQLVGHGARVLLGDVIEASIRRGNELDLDGDRFGHCSEPLMCENRVPAKSACICAAT